MAKSSWGAWRAKGGREGGGKGGKGARSSGALHEEGGGGNCPGDGILGEGVGGGRNQCARLRRYDVIPNYISMFVEVAHCHLGSCVFILVSCRRRRPPV